MWLGEVAVQQVRVYSMYMCVITLSQYVYVCYNTVSVCICVSVWLGEVVVQQVRVYSMYMCVITLSQYVYVCYNIVSVCICVSVWLGEVRARARYVSVTFLVTLGGL